VLATVFFALALSSAAAPQPRPVVPVAQPQQVILLCARTDAHGKAVDAKVMQSSGSAELDKSAQSTVIGTAIVAEDAAKDGAWLPVAISVGGDLNAITPPNCSSLAELAH
jgi:hypothetical protein